MNCMEEDYPSHVDEKQQFTVGQGHHHIPSINTGNQTMVVDRRLCVAPMMGWTDRYFRELVRLITRHTLLYTEMITTWTLLHGDLPRLLQLIPAETNGESVDVPHMQKVAMQLGGNDPQDLATCAKLAAEWGYAEVNLNLGCPSARVNARSFGACLMAEPELVADCVSAMVAAVSIPITVKQRLGIDDQGEDYPKLQRFVDKLATAGCKVFIIHARRAVLKGLSTKDNRQVPTLRYDLVYQLKRDFPHLQILINGGITNLQQVATQLCQVDGVMIGRAAYHNPWLLADADKFIFGSDCIPVSRQAVVNTYLSLMAKHLDSGVPLSKITRHLLGLFHGIPGARAWRRIISTSTYQPGANLDFLQQAISYIQEGDSLSAATVHV